MYLIVLFVGFQTANDGTTRATTLTEGRFLSNTKASGAYREKSEIETERSGAH